MRSRVRYPKAITAASLAVSTILAAALVLTPSLVAQQRGRCAVAELPGHLVLPDGKVYQARELKVCFQAWHHPDQGRHLIIIDGRQWGYLMSRSETSDGLKADVPLFVFTPRTENHHVRLLGYAWPENDGMSVHLLHAPGHKVIGGLTDARMLLERADEERFVLVAARVE